MRPAFEAWTGAADVDAEVEAEVDLLVDVAALVDVGAVVGEARFDRRVHELLERPLPQAIGRALLGQRGDGRAVLLAQLAVDGQVRLEQVGRIVDLQRRRVGQDRRHDLGEEGIVDVDAALAEHLLEHLDLDLGHRLVAGGVAGEDAHRRVQVLVVEQREEADLEAGVGAGHTGGRRLVAVIAHVADADARFDVGRRDAIDDQLRAAVIHEVVRREHRDLRRHQPHLGTARHLGRHLALAEQHLARAGGDEPRRAGLERRQRLLADRPLQDQRAVGLLDQLRLGVAGQREHRRPGAVLLERDRQRLERRAVRIDPQLEVAGLADERAGLGEGEGRPLLPTGHEPHAARDQQEQDEDRQDLAHPRDSTGVSRSRGPRRPARAGCVQLTRRAGAGYNSWFALPRAGIV